MAIISSEQWLLYDKTIELGRHAYVSVFSHAAAKDSRSYSASLQITECTIVLSFILKLFGNGITLLQLEPYLRFHTRCLLCDPFQDTCILLGSFNLIIAPWLMLI